MKGRVKSSGSNKSGGFGKDRDKKGSGGSSRAIDRGSNSQARVRSTGGATKSTKPGGRFNSRPAAVKKTESEDERLWNEWGLGDNKTESPRQYRSEFKPKEEVDDKIGGFKVVKKTKSFSEFDEKAPVVEKRKGPKQLTARSEQRSGSVSSSYASQDRKPSFGADRRSKSGSENSWNDNKPRKVFNMSDDKKVKDKRTKPEKREKSADDDGKIRLNRYIANSGICSRREADTFIESGLVKVNGVTVTEMGSKVARTDEVKFDGQMIKPEKKVYILMNKPKGYVTTTEDPEERKTVMDLIGSEVSQRVYPVGRLDRNTTGVIMLTNDGELTKSLTHPKYNRKKIYHVSLDKNVTRADMDKLLSGIELEDGIASADVVDYPTPDIKSEIGIEIHSGKNRIVRRMMEGLGYNVLKLDRVFFCGMTKKGVPRGKWRFLSDVEVNMLRMGAYE